MASNQHLHKYTIYAVMWGVKISIIYGSVLRVLVILLSSMKA